MLVRAKCLADSHAQISVSRTHTPACYMQISLARQAVILAEGVPVETIRDDVDCDLPYATLRTWELMAAVA